jgi:hypothetical protein
MGHVPQYTFGKSIERYSGNRYVKSFNYFDPNPWVAFVKLKHRLDLLDIEICLRAHKPKLYHIQTQGGKLVTRSQMLTEVDSKARTNILMS